MPEMVIVSSRIFTTFGCRVSWRKFGIEERIFPSDENIFSSSFKCSQVNSFPNGFRAKQKAPRQAFFWNFDITLGHYYAVCDVKEFRFHRNSIPLCHGTKMFLVNKIFFLLLFKYYVQSTVSHSNCITKDLWPNINSFFVFDTKKIV